MSDATRVCQDCGGPTPDYYTRSCSWACAVSAARKRGAREHLPNGLPVQCITATGMLLEVSHGDHPDYKFPVDVDGANPIDEDWEYPQTHALIYCDGCVAVTLYECNYAMWNLADGAYRGGRYALSDERLAVDSLTKIRAAYPRVD